MTSLLCRMQSEEFCFKPPHIEEVKMPKRILFVLTSHDRKGQAESKDAAPSGFYLSEVSHPYDVLTKKDMKLIS